MNNPMTLQDWRDHRDTVKHPHPLCDEAIRSLEALEAVLDRLASKSRLWKQDPSINKTIHTPTRELAARIEYARTRGKRDESN